MPSPAPAVVDAEAERPRGHGTEVAAGSPRVWPAAVVIGIAAFVVAVIGSWIPAAWADEAATMSAARRSLPELWHMVHNVDAVHGLYYAALHVWFEVVPYTVFSLRLPSAIATGLAAALTVVLGARLAGRWTGIVAGIVFLLLPRVTSAGIEGRSYAFTAVVAVTLTLVFVIAVQRTVERRPRAWLWWVLYGAVALLCGLLFIYEVLILAAHALTLLVWVVRRGGPGGRRPHLRAALWWLVPTVLVGVLLLPFVHLTSGEAAKQLYFMGKMGWGTGILKPVFILQFFMGSKSMAFVGWLAIAVGAITAVLLPRLRHRVPAVELTLPIILLPPAAIYVASVLVRPLYNARYFTFETPLVAIAIALGLTFLPWRRTAVLWLALLAVLSAPQWSSQRQPMAKDGSTWDTATALIQRERAAEPAGTRDAIYYGPLPSHVNRTTEFVEASYPQAFAGMRDLTVERSAVSIGELWAQRRPVTAPLPDLGDVDRIWFVGEPTADQPRVLQDQIGATWHTADEWKDGAFVIKVYERD